jgi:1-acyl-sn-glycerol-3-phosphate acyltransferase
MTDRGKAEDMLLAPRTGGAMFQAFCRVFFIYYCRLTVAGKDHLPASPFIICSNHTSHIDSAVLMTASGLPFSAFAMLGASDYFFDSWRTRFLVSRFMNVIPIDRHGQHKSLRRSLTMCEEFLQRMQGNLILYPKVRGRVTARSRHLRRVLGCLRSTLGCPLCLRILRVLITFWPRENSCHVGEPSPSASESRFGSNRISSILSGGVDLEGPLSNCSNSASTGWAGGLPPET